MYAWLFIIIGVIALLGLLQLLSARTRTEGFVTVDLNTAIAQRQGLQMEGERRYNNFARLQNPKTALSADQVEAALQQATPVATSTSNSLLSLLGFVGLGAADDGSNKQGAGVEQTGMLQQKINFCEGITAVNCDLLDDPRLAECGFCHRDGTSSSGKAHRGGMYISSDDQIRANEVSNANGQVAAIYKPTIGSCKPQNFTLMKENCQVRELQMQCQSAGGPTVSNPCGQCFGSAPPNTTGMLYMGPKPRAYTATLWVSHPGSHSNGGAGFSVKLPNGIVISLPPSNQPMLDPQQLTLTLTEGDMLEIAVVGMPPVWCGWLSSQDGNRTVSLDIGAQTITPASGFSIAGDKRAGVVSKAMATADPTVWANFQAQVPNSVLWYLRRDEVLPGSVVSAWYGLALPSQGAEPQGVDVTSYIKIAAGEGFDVLVDPTVLQIADPAPGMIKHLWITQDNGPTPVWADGGTVPAKQIYNAMTMIFTVPATLVDPLFNIDKAACPTGPIVFTEVGAGLMGSHSCFKADGSFNPNLYCMRELWAAAGGTPQGQLYPQDDTSAAALALKDPTSGALSLDATVAAMNNAVNIAIYGVDMNGAPQDFPTIKQYALAYLGIVMNNPCDGPNAQTGPHSEECLDYLWRTSGNASQDGAPNINPSTLPYAYCSAAGQAAPLNGDGTVNQANVTAANGNGAIQNVRTFYQGIFNRSQDSSDFDSQAAAMRDCFGINISPPQSAPSECPVPNPDEWQCFGPSKLQQPEVFQVNQMNQGTGGANIAYIGQQVYQFKQSDAAAVCASYGATVATTAQLTAAQAQGADWCSTGWVADSTTPAYPITTSVDPGCGSAPGIQQFLPSTGLAAVNCYGKKPAPNTPGVYLFGPLNNTWYAPTSLPIGITNTSVIMAKEVANNVYCAGPANQNCTFFESEDACNQSLANNDPIAGVIPLLMPDSNTRIDQYVRARV